MSSFISLPSLSYSFFSKTETKEDEETENVYFKKAISEMSSESENSLKNFISILEKCISTVSKRYRENILQQIAVLSQNDAALLTAEEFVKLQKESDKLKTYLRDYRLLAENSGKMAFNQAVSSLHSGVTDPGQIVCQVYCAFEQLYTNEYSMNDEYERNLKWMEEILSRKMEKMGEWKMEGKNKDNETEVLINWNDCIFHCNNKYILEKVKFCSLQHKNSTKPNICFLNNIVARRKRDLYYFKYVNLPFAF